MKIVRFGVLSVFLVALLSTPVRAGDWPPTYRTGGKSGYFYGHTYGSGHATHDRSWGDRSPRWGYQPKGYGSYGYGSSRLYYGSRSYGHYGSGYRHYGYGRRGYGHSGSSFSFGFGPRARCDR